ncbi:MAG: polyphosphate polymerase domain-containing protein [Oscillospiraceae bacterium]|nr:polyphosphate polymerase domain-containing protein [Oscillospiraceae bacterium]
MPAQNHQVLRQELKYLLGRGEYAALTQRCQAVMHRDSHAGPDGSYQISSLYFDDLGDTALLQNYAGVSRREKFRIRIYNDDPASLHLEKKVKNGGLGTKYMCPMNPEQLQRLLDGDLSWMMDTGHPLMQELYARMKNDLLRPKTIVAYRREPFVYGPGNVRVTFDYDIRSGICAHSLLDKDTPLVPAAPGQVVMEVKYDAFLPDIIRMILQEGTPRVRAFSKYAACRQYDI